MIEVGPGNVQRCATNRRRCPSGGPQPRNRHSDNGGRNAPRPSPKSPSPPLPLPLPYVPQRSTSPDFSPPSALPPPPCSAPPGNPRQPPKWLSIQSQSQQLPRPPSVQSALLVPPQPLPWEHAGLKLRIQISIEPSPQPMISLPAISVELSTSASTTASPVPTQTSQTAAHAPVSPRVSGLLDILSAVRTSRIPWLVQLAILLLSAGYLAGKIFHG